ncbi:zinc-ribbon domain-containing protein [Pseudoflavonifractor phocaeensis]|uniref:zinc-ribbon domain-containing protein n=1 Tax=Pseudoflavonifractor phocaeensis TaxID=1870988 RepID=UPI0025A3DEE6|nr:zinc-ribbon domain-containing protein [Pseudoflavonifractor phocaeensis]MDM8237854.1 zinc-ribbon domain-containing protein [Pseudoflavonifractor phocaeensis]
MAGENDLASQFPELAAQWNQERNGVLTPKQVAPYSNRKVWWRCELGHEYQASVGARTLNGSGCPYCAGKKVLSGFNDLATRFPDLANQWHPTLNGTLKPNMVTAGSHRKVWWQCTLGHVWKAMIYSRTGPKQCGCPVCAGKMGKQQRRRAPPENAI